MIRRRLSLGVAAHALDKVVVAVVQLATIPILVQAWGLELFGLWTMVMTIPSFLVLTDFGIVNSAWARMVGFVAREEWAQARASLHTAWLVTNGLVVVLACAGTAVIWLLPDTAMPRIESLSGAEARLVTTLLLVYGLVTIIFRLNTAAYRATLRYTMSSLCGTGSYFIENLAVVAIAAMGFGPLAAAIALLALRLAAIIGLCGLSFRIVPRLSPGFSSASMSEWRQLWKPALAASALGFGLVIYLQGSVVILGAIAGAAAVPGFVAVRTLSRLGVQFGTLVSLPVSQEFGSAMGSGNTFRAGRLFGLVLCISAPTALFLSVGLALAGAPFVQWWTEGAIRVDPSLIAFMAISSFAAMLWNPLSNFILAINRQHAYSYANIMASGLGLVLLVGLSGPLGAAAGGVSFALVDTVTLVAVLMFIIRQWAPSSDFRSGIAKSFDEMRRPISLLRSLKG